MSRAKETKKNQKLTENLAKSGKVFEPKLPPIDSIPSGNFSVRVDQPDNIFEQFQNGKSGEMGRIFLESPINDITVEGTSTIDHFNLRAEIDPEVGLERRVLGWRGKNYFKHLLKRYPDVKERGGMYIVTLPNGTNLLIGNERGGVGEEIIISTGEMRDFMHDKVGVFDSPKLDRETFTTTLDAFSLLLKDCVNEFYRFNRRVAPSEEIVLGVPKEDKRHHRMINDEEPEELMGKLIVERPNITFDDVGGQSQAKHEVQGLAFALKNPELYTKWGTRPPKGILMWGPPGTGKTLLARALASEAEARFLHVKAADIGSKWYGESERIVKQIFEFANNSSEKTIIFFDEIDAIAPERDGAHEATRRVMSTLLVSMDGLISEQNVIVVASTNRKESIDSALIRAGRFDRLVEVPKPDAEGRAQIFQIHLKKAEAIATRPLFDEFDLSSLADKCDGATGADIAEIIRRTLEEKVNAEGSTGEDPGPVKFEDIIKQLDVYERDTKS